MSADAPAREAVVPRWHVGLIGKLFPIPTIERNSSYTF
jgi:hypothetical protein